MNLNRNQEMINDEPYFDFPSVEELTLFGTKEHEICSNQNLRQKEKHYFFKLIFDFINNNDVRGDYFEFGVHKCRTFRMALLEAQRQSLIDMHFYAFDSFEGLPDANGSHQVKGWGKNRLHTNEKTFKDILKKTNLCMDKIKIITGFYSDSLNQALHKNLIASNVKCSLINIDCDLYESAQDVFNFIDPFLQEGTSIYIDEYYCGYKGNPNYTVAKAFHEFKETSRWNFEPHLNVGWWGRSFITIKKEI